MFVRQPGTEDLFMHHRGRAARCRPRRPVSGSGACCWSTRETAA